MPIQAMSTNDSRLVRKPRIAQRQEDDQVIEETETLTVTRSRVTTTATRVAGATRVVVAPVVTQEAATQIVSRISKGPTIQIVWNCKWNAWVEGMSAKVVIIVVGLALGMAVGMVLASFTAYYYGKAKAGGAGGMGGGAPPPMY